MAPSWSPDKDASRGTGERKAHLLAAQVRLLNVNANTAIIVTLIAAPLLAYVQSKVVSPRVVIAWLLYMVMASTARFLLSRRYWQTRPQVRDCARWNFFLAAGAFMAGLGWGMAGVMLYPEQDAMRQVFLVFVLGGMMLGASSLLAPRTEAFLAFLLPSGILPALRLMAQSDDEHIAMGILAALFTVAVVVTTWRLHRTIESSLNLQFVNQDLVEDLREANNRTEALNQELELRVEARTAELHQAAKRLRTEIEQREKMEGELLRTRNLESLGLLAGGIAHDFNNFLTIVQGNLELAQMELDAEAPVQELLADSAHACSRAAFLSAQLLTFAKGGAPVRRVANLSRLVTDSVQLARAGTSITIHADVAADLWPAEVDAGQIGQVLHNILLNAKQAMPDGGVIDVRAENIVESTGSGEQSSGSAVRISIRDTGPGIAVEVLPRIFDPYFTTKQKGNGLGLATAYAIVSRHGGHISAESTPGEGALLSFTLPAAPGSIPREAPPNERKRTGVGRVLVMDDEDSLRSLLERVLTALGYEVRSARDGAEAIALYQHAAAAGRNFDAVLLDLTVSGGMGGIETAARLKEFDPTVKLIVSSGYSDAAVMANFREHGFDDVIPKPWQAAQISEVLERVLAP